MPAAAEGREKRHPTYVGIILFKLLKGSLFLVLAIVAYTLSDNNLPQEYRHLIDSAQPLLELLRVHPGNKFFTHLAEQIGNLTEANVLWAAAGTLVYSLFALVEGVGLMFRVSWAGWLTIGESAFFIPIEIYELLHLWANPERRGSPITVLIILPLNILIVWYLFQNRDRLFRHHHHH